MLFVLIALAPKTWVLRAMVRSNRPYVVIVVRKSHADAHTVPLIRTSVSTVPLLRTSVNVSSRYSTVIFEC